MPAEDKLACYVLHLATGVSYRSIGLTFDMSEGYVVRVVASVSAAIMLEYFDIIGWPSRPEALEAVATWEARYGIEGCVGAMDGTHIHLRATALIKKAQWNYKRFHSFVLHAVVDNKYVTLININ